MGRAFKDYGLILTDNGLTCRQLNIYRRVYGNNTKKLLWIYLMVSTDTLRACLHEGGRPQVGEVTTLAVVAKKSPRLSAILQPWDLGVRLLVRLQ